jgi:hypothetical protein
VARVLRDAMACGDKVTEAVRGNARGQV